MQGDSQYDIQYLEFSHESEFESIFGMWFNWKND